MLKNYLLIKNKIKNIGDHILSMLPLIALISLLCIALTLNISGYKIEFIASSSMEPTLMTGQLVLAKKIDASQCFIGDIVTYQANDFTITHRIIKEREDSFEFKGDNNDFSDGFIPKAKVLYKIVAY